uniref:Uncharacterized protein n=1 Tax=Oryza sativa subsp. japonica TaxID=39947 RepID=Q5SML8_ORYSJ|nr:hypothetical protein [Oryza sativa Japonica Group]
MIFSPGKCRVRTHGQYHIGSYQDLSTANHRGVDSISPLIYIQQPTATAVIDLPLLQSRVPRSSGLYAPSIIVIVALGWKRWQEGQIVGLSLGGGWGGVDLAPMRPSPPYGSGCQREEKP